MLKFASYAQNCPGALYNRTAYVAGACNYLDSCAYVVDDTVLADPAKDFRVIYKCNAAKDAPLYTVYIPPEVGFGSFAHLVCPRAAAEVREGEQSRPLQDEVWTCSTKGSPK